MVKQAGKHIRAFAGECLSAVTALVWFFKLVLEPVGKLAKHGQCMLLLQDIHDIILLLGDRAVQASSLLRSTLIVHHKLFIEIYGRGMAKIKFHLLYHSADCLERFSVNLNCFKTERVHQ